MELGEKCAGGKRYICGLDSLREMTAYCSDLRLEDTGRGTFRITACEVVLSLRSVGTR